MGLGRLLGHSCLLDCLQKMRYEPKGCGSWMAAASVTRGADGTN